MTLVVFDRSIGFLAIFFVVVLLKRVIIRKVNQDVFDTVSGFGIEKFQVS